MTRPHPRGAVLAALWLVACAAPAEPMPWATDDPRPDLSDPAVAAWELPELSLYATHVSGPSEDRPGFRQRGAFGVGNGAAFALVGLADPLNTLHGATGPTYDKEGRFFADVGWTLEVDGVEAPFDEEWAARPRGTGLVVTRADAAEHTLYTLDFAPRGTTTRAPWLVRRMVVTSSSSEPTEVHLRRTGGSVRQQDGVWIDDTGARWLATLPVDAPLEEDEEGLYLDLGTLGADEAVAVDLVRVAMEAGTSLSPVRDEVAAADLDALLAETVGSWSTEAARRLRIESSDPRWADLYDGLVVGIRVQTSADGGVCPMSRYTGLWLRDTIGPARFLARAGLQVEARDALEALYACHRDRGDIGNACHASETGAPTPDWAALPPFEGRTAAEGPSYLPLAWDTVARWSGDEAMIGEKWDYLSRAVLAQQIDAEGRQSWSGDETFRAAMGASLGYPLEYDLPGLAWSANSGWLTVAAASRMADRAEALGEDPTPFLDRAALARQGLDAWFLQADGHYAAIHWHTAGSANEVGVDPRPYEDANLKALWLGVLSPEEAWDDLQGLYAQAGRGDGTLVTPLDPGLHDVLGLGVEEGVFTGMLPGYALWALSATGHPEADAAFAALHRFADPAGQLSEGHILDDASALQVVYDPSGNLGDISARYRPWEGGIVGDALLFHLLGAEPVDGALRLAPHLPHDQTWLEAREIRAGTHVVDLRLERDRRGLSATITARTPSTVVLELPHEPGARVRDGEQVVLPGGEERVRFPPVTLAPGESWTARVP